MATTPGVTEVAITFHNEQWTAEVARLLLEVDEDWVGYRDDFSWSWNDDTYTVYAAICEERGWKCTSLEASVAMLQALRTGEVSMKLSDSTHSSDGYAQWSLTEMRVLGSQMRDIVDGKSPTVRWSAQLAVFVEVMKVRDKTYAYHDRTVEDYAYRAGKFIPEAIRLQIDPKQTNGKVTPKAVRTARRTRRASSSGPINQTRRTTRSQSIEGYVDSDDEPLARLRRPRTRATGTAVRSATTMRSVQVLKRPIDSDEDSLYHDPTSEDEDLLWADESSQSVLEGSVPITQEITSQGELPPVRVAGNEQSSTPSQDLVDQAQPSPPQEDTTRQPSLKDDRQIFSATNQSRDSPRDDSPASSHVSPRVGDLVPPQSEHVQASRRPSLHQDEPVQQRQDTADPTQEGQYDDTSTRRPPRKHQRVHGPDANSRVRNSRTDSPHLFRSLNPYDRPAKPWGEFVVEVLLAERTARNEDELDYVRFVRGLYEI